MVVASRPMTNATVERLVWLVAGNAKTRVTKQVARIGTRTNGSTRRMESETGRSPLTMSKNQSAGGAKSNSTSQRVTACFSDSRKTSAQTAASTEIPRIDKTIRGVIL